MGSARIVGKGWGWSGVGVWSGLLGVCWAGKPAACATGTELDLDEVAPGSETLQKGVSSSCTVRAQANVAAKSTRRAIRMNVRSRRKVIFFIYQP